MMGGGDGKKERESLERGVRRRSATSKDAL